MVRRREAAVVADLPLCPKCGSLAVGERCGSCGAQIQRTPPPATEMLSVAVPGLAIEGLETSAKQPELVERTKRVASAYLSLQPSEEAVLHAASRIFAGFVASGIVTDDNQNELSDRSVKLATRMALVIEKYIQSDNEDW